ncbi:tail fiber domain-containing protein [Brevibacillus porteri]|uniref:tail fiber domain-containing protein n=1 Tax=Brevibacillus porteri TaxID=2126350 RepID=UPI00370BD8C7
MTNLIGTSDNPSVDAVFGDHSSGGTGVSGRSVSGYGIFGLSATGVGVYARSQSRTALYAETLQGYPSPVLQVIHRDNGKLIQGFNKDGGMVFEVGADGLVTVNGTVRARHLTSSGNIHAGLDVFARGVRLTSDKNVKENFSNVNTLEILDNLEKMPIQSWNYKEDPTSERHIGPTAQEFQVAFGLNGEDDVHISSIDLQGIALAAIQGLNEKLKAENAQLHASLAKLEERLSALEAKS